MPSKSQAQHNLMAGIAHGWKPSGMKKPPSKQVAAEFSLADKTDKRYKKRVRAGVQASALKEE